MAAGKFTPMSGFRRIFETGLIILTVAALFMVLSLFTYHPSDPGWSQTAWGGKVHNAAGNAGAWLADLMFFVFGVFAYLIPVLIVALGWAIFWKPYRLLEVDYFAVGLRIIGFIALFLSMSAMGSMNFTDIHNFSSGGLIGDMLYTAILPIFGQLGTTLVLLCLIAASITLFTGWSWLMLAEKIGEAVTGALNFVYTLPSRIVGWFAGKAGYQRVHSDSQDVDDAFSDDDEDDFIPSPAGVDEDFMPHRSAPKFSFSRKTAVVAENDDLGDDKDDSAPVVGERREPEFNLNTAKETSSSRSEPTFTASWSALEDDDDWEPALPWANDKETQPAVVADAPVMPVPVVAKPGAAPTPTP